ncbi:MAG: hypothetical protein K6G23_09790 [Lachnospiraceae bacterium]|nr:hypothetical protein [Lachnospiraceae bacterium]
MIVWNLNLLTGSEQQALLTLLPPGYAAAYHQAGAPGRKRELLGSGAVIGALMKVYGKTQEPERSRSGKPDYPDVHFNISHSGGMLIAALSGCEIGIDIERIRQVPVAVAKKFHLPADDAEAFFVQWTRMEACVKADGQGIGALMTINQSNYRICSDFLKFDKETYVYAIAMPINKVGDPAQLCAKEGSKGENLKAAEEAVLQVLGACGKLSFPPEEIII